MKNFAIVLICISVYLCQPVIAAASESSSKMPHPIDRNPAYLRNAEAFAASFGDPNMVIGVFERSSRSPYTGQTVSEMIGGPHERLAILKFLLVELFPLEMIQGELDQPVIFVPIPSISLASPGSPAHGSPGFYAPSGTKWLLALRKITPEFRKARFGEEINKYQWLNDDTLFTLARYGFGQFCIQWTEKIHMDMAPFLIKAPEDIIDDFRIMYELSTDLRESRLDLSRAADMTKLLETEQAKSIYAEILRKKPAKPQVTDHESSERR